MGTKYLIEFEDGTHEVHSEEETGVWLNNTEKIENVYRLLPNKPPQKVVVNVIYSGSTKAVYLSDIYGNYLL